MRRYELTDQQWVLIEDLFPPERGKGRPYRGHHDIVRPYRLAGDKEYDISHVRSWLNAHGIKAVIPEKAKPYGRKKGRPPQLDRESYQRRNVVERCIGWLKHACRIATRYEKTAVNFLAMLKLAMIQRYFRTYLRDTT